MTWTPKQLRVLAQHQRCDPKILPSGPHWGLYCGQHGTWIKWINSYDKQIIEKIINDGK